LITFPQSTWSGGINPWGGDVERIRRGRGSKNPEESITDGKKKKNKNLDKCMELHSFRAKCKEGRQISTPPESKKSEGVKTASFGNQTRVTRWGKFGGKVTKGL